MRVPEPSHPRCPVPQRPGLAMVLWGLLWLLGVSTAAEPLKKRPFFRHMDMPPEFVPDQYLAMEQDAEGYLWVGSDEGLFRHDGHQWIAYPRVPGPGAGTIASKHCTAVFDIHADGRALWLGTPCGVERLDLDRGAVDLWSNEDAWSTGDTVGKTPPKILAIQRTVDGWLWLGTSSGLRWLDPQRQWAARLPADQTPEPLQGSSVYTLFADTDGSLWIGGEDGLFHWSATPDAGAIREILFAEPNSDPTHRHIEAIHRDSAGTLWVTTGDGLRRLVGKGTDDVTLELERDLPALCVDVPEQWHYGMATGPGGTLWVSSGGTLIAWEPGSANAQCFKRFDKDPNGVGGNVGNLFVDRAGTLWAATNRTLDRYHAPPFTVWKYAFDPAVADYGWRVGWSTSPLLDPDGHLWVGSDLGLFQIDLESRSLVRHFMRDAPGLLGQIDKDTVGNLPSFSVFALAREADGTLWAGTAQGLGRLRPGADRFEIIPVDTRQTDPPRIEALQLQGPHLFVGTNKALHRLDLGSGSWSRIALPPALRTDDAETAPVQTIIAADLAVDHRNRLWVGTKRYGLLVLEPGSDGLTLPPEFEASPLCGQGKITELHVEAPDHLWVAHETAGLQRLDLDAGTFSSPPWAEHFQNRVIRKLLVDGSHLWLLTSSGLHRVNHQSGEIRRFDGRDGLTEPRLMYGMLRLGEGHLLLTGSALFELDPERATPPNIPPVRWTDFRLFNERQQEPILGTERLELDHRHSVATLEFSALGAPHPETLRYFHQLEGVDGRWLETRRGQNYVTYTRLAPGRYRVRVRAAAEGSPGPGDPSTEASLELIVHPPGWLSPWAKVAYGASILALLWGLVAVQRRKLRRERSLNQELRRLARFKDEFLANTSHELRTPLFGILGMAESLRDGARGPITQEAREALDVILDSGRRLTSQVDELLALSQRPTPNEPSTVEQISQASHGAEDRASGDGRPTILVVDDEPVNLLVLESYFADPPYRLLSADNGRAALAILEAQPIDLVVLDVMMPEMSGIDVCRTIRKQYSKEALPIIFLSAKGGAADCEAGLGAGGNAYLVKPVDKHDLLARVDRELATLPKG